MGSGSKCSIEEKRANYVTRSKRFIQETCEKAVEAKVREKIEQSLETYLNSLCLHVLGPYE